VLVRVGVRIEVLARDLPEQHVAGRDAGAGEVLPERLVQAAERPA